MADALGVDFDVLDDFPTSFVLTSGRKNLAQALARRLMTPAGFLQRAHGGDADYGYDLRGMLNQAQTLDQIASIEAAVKGQVQLDERVNAVEVTATFTLATSTLSVDILVQDDEGPFRLVVSVTEATADLVLASA